MPLQIRKFKNILALRRGEKVFGFHSENMEMAQLDQTAWEALDESISRNPNHEVAKAELEEWSQENTEVHSQDFEDKVTTFVVNLTQVCNLRCTYCAAGGDGTYGDKKSRIEYGPVEGELRRRIEALSRGDEFNLHFFGGEPLIHPEGIRRLYGFAKLVAAGTGVEIRCSITTNGTLLSPKIAELLAEVKCTVNLSLDGPAEINDLRRPSKDSSSSTAATLLGLENLLKVRERLGPLCVTAVFGKGHLDLPGTYEFFSQFNFDRINFSYEITEHEETDTLNEFLKAYEDLISNVARHGENELRKITNVEHCFSVMDENKKISNHCGAGRSLIYSDSRGELYPCAWLINDKSERLKSEDIGHQKLKSLVELNNCQSCWAKHICGGGCVVANKTKNKDKHVKDTYFCSRTRTQIALNLFEYADIRSRQ